MCPECEVLQEELDKAQLDRSSMATVILALRGTVERRLSWRQRITGRI